MRFDLQKIMVLMEARQIDGLTDQWTNILSYRGVGMHIVCQVYLNCHLVAQKY